MKRFFILSSKGKITLLLLSLLMLNFLILKVIKAESSSEGITISPPILEISVNPGETKQEKIRVTNPGKSLVEVYPKVMDFRAKGDGGEPLFYEGETNSKFSLSKWISFNQPKLALASEQVVEFTYQISVPEDAEPGGHYGAVFFASEPSVNENETKVTLTSMIGSLVLVKVPGQIVEKGAIEEFVTNKNIYFNGPVKFTSRVANAGNVHIKPKGNIIIKDMSGKEVERVSVNEQGGNVLPDSTRKFDNNWPTKALQIGRYQAILNINYGESKENLTKTIYFWLVPLWLTIVLVIIALMLIFLLFKTIKKAKSRARTKNKTETGKVILR